MVARNPVSYPELYEYDSNLTYREFPVLEILNKDSPLSFAISVDRSFGPS